MTNEKQLSVSQREKLAQGFQVMEQIRQGLKRMGELIEGIREEVQVEQISPGNHKTLVEDDPPPELKQNHET